MWFDGCDEAVEEILAEGVVFRAFWVPLDTEMEGVGGIGDGFDEVVVGSCDDSERAGVRDGLPVAAVNSAVGESQRGGYAIVVGRNDGVGLVPVIIGSRMRVGQVLVEITASDEGHELHAEADTKDGRVRGSLEYGAEQGDFVCLAVGMQGCSLGVSGSAELLHARVISAGEDQRTAESELIRNEIWDGREDDG